MENMTLCRIFLRGVTLVNLIQIVCGNILDVSMINFNPIYEPDSTASFAAILNGADITSELSFQRSVDLDSGLRSSVWCSQGEDDLTQCGLPQGSTIASTGKVTLLDTASDKFGVYGCRAERYNWTTVSATIFIRDDAHFNPEYFTTTVSVDEEVRLLMNVGASGGAGSLVWILNRETGGHVDLSTNISANELYISKADKETNSGVHHYYYEDQPDRGGLIRLIVRGCLDNLWGPDCQYTCPTCYNGGVCDDVTGRCICPPGFSGDHCGKACPASMFGQDCSGSCSTLESGRTDCSGAVFCLPDPYGCSCAAGWTGLSCDQACPAGMYGAGCSQTCHCESSVSCDSATGACSNGCEDGWTGDQCQVTILDTIAILRQAGVDDTNVNFFGLFMIGDNSVTDDPSLKYYIGREVDTGPGETGHGASLQIDPSGDVMTTDWTDTGLPPDTTFGKIETYWHTSYRSFIDKDTGGDARVGAYRMSIDYRGFTDRNILLNEYRGDSNSEIWPEKLSTTVGVGEPVTLVVLIKTSVDSTSLRWRHNGGSDIIEWKGVTSVTINGVRKSDEGIYECYVQGNRETGRHAIMRLIVRSCPSTKYGFDCSNACPSCYAGGVCHDITGECVCRAGFMGDNCETPCSNNDWGRSCTAVCSSPNPGCSNRLFSAPNPAGIACSNGFTGNRCQTECGGTKFGADCELDCNCDGTCSPVSGCPSDQCTSDYEGTYCQALRSNLPCPSGYFGTLCNYPCHCDGDVDCERTTGYCPNDVDCAEGWAGSDCQQALPRLLESPIVSGVTNDSVLIIWNAWTDSYDYGNGPVHSYQVDYTWTDGAGNSGEIDEPFIVTGDSSARINIGHSPFTIYDFYISVRREVEGQVVTGVMSSSSSIRTDCEAPLLAPVMQTSIVNGVDSITITWSLPATASSTWLQCDSSSYSFSLSYWLVDDSTEIITIPVEGSESAMKQVDGLRLCTSYYFSVVILNSVGLAGPANHTVVTTDPMPPEPVQGARLAPDGPNHLTITWSEPFSQCGTPSYNVTRKLLLRDQCDISYSDIVTWTEVHSTNIEYNDLRPHSTYEFGVLAIFRGFEAQYAYRVTYDTSESVPLEAPRNISVDNSEKSLLNFTWAAPSCGTRNGDISYSYTLYQLSGEPIEGPITGTQEETTKYFDNLPFDAAFNFTVCASTFIGSGPCDYVEARTLPRESICEACNYEVPAIVLGCLVIILGIYSTGLTVIHLKSRKSNQKAEQKMNVYQDPTPSGYHDGQSTYEEIRTTHLNISTKDESYENTITVT